MGEDSGRGAATTGRRRHDDEHATTTTRRQRPCPHFCHRNVATEPRRCGDTTTRRRRGGDDDSLAAAAAPRLTVAAAPTLTVAAVPRPSQKLQAPLQPQPRCCPKPSGALTVPAAALPHGPHCSPDARGWVVEARTTTRRRRRDDQHWWSGRGGKDGG